MITNSVTVDSSTQTELVRAAALILGNRCRGESIVDDVMARAVAEFTVHDWTGPVTLDVWLFALTVRACRTWLEGLLRSETWARTREAERLQHDEHPHVDATRLRLSVSEPDRLTASLSCCMTPSGCRKRSAPESQEKRRNSLRRDEVELSWRSRSTWPGKHPRPSHHTRPKTPMSRSPATSIPAPLVNALTPRKRS